MKKITTLALLLLGTALQSPASASQCTLKVKAFIDGRSVLAIEGDKAHWIHQSWAAPGRLGGSNLPTLLTYAGTENSWTPQWPNSGENRVFYPLSSVHSVDSHAGVPAYTGAGPVALDVITARGSVTVTEDAESNHSRKYLLVTFNDEAPNGGADYEICLNY
jgi:hypothetical protein